MATAANLELLAAAGLSCSEMAPSPSDILIALECLDGDTLHSAMAAATQALDAGQRAQGATSNSETAQAPPTSQRLALDARPAANLALISTPGEYAAAEAQKALQLGLHTMIFSDNVTIEDEIRLKVYAQKHGLLAMGPDCGTAIIDGIPLGFANVVRRGSIGLVAASGTGLQQVACLIDRLGAGISHAIGTGGRDLKVEVGGITMRQALALLAADDGTDVIVLISKPPAPEVATRVIAAAQQCGKPVVVNFLGAAQSISGGDLYQASTLADAATLAVGLAAGQEMGGSKTPSQNSRSAGKATRRPDFAAGQQYIRALFSGGTFCYEALQLLDPHLPDVRSNIGTRPDQALDDVWISQGHTLLDLGDDLFTRGRPHPMIDHRLRNARILQEAQDPTVALLLLDVVLGYGAHPDPAAEMAPAIVEARQLAAAGGRELAVLGWVCGTSGDPQQLARQEAQLAEAGVELSDSSTAAIRRAATIIEELHFD